MSEPTAPGYGLRVEDYLTLERQATVKHELVGDEMHAMAGASRRHSLVTGNAFAALRDGARDGDCRIHHSDMKVRIGDTFYYPGVVVACGREPDDDDIEDEPCLVVEVTSPSTQVTDRREKLAAYQSIATLHAYLIVAQDRRWVTHYVRDDAGRWQKGDLVEDGCLELACPPRSKLRLQDIYAGVTHGPS